MIIWMKRIGPIVLGAFGGFLYYSYIGCNTNTCAITSDPYISTAYGAVMGSLFSQWGNKKDKKSESVDDSEGRIEQ